MGLIGEAGGFPGVEGVPGAHEYWSLTKAGDSFGKKSSPDKSLGPEAFLQFALAHFTAVAERYLTGDAPFTAKLNPAYAPYGDYDQLMRLEEWYGRQ